MALKGSLDDASISSLLAIIKEAKDTGKLTVTAKDGAVSIYFKEGVPVNAEGDKNPLGSVEKFVILEKGEFEFVKLSDVKESNDKELIQRIIDDPSNTKTEWNELKKKFPIYGISFNISETQTKNEIELTKDEWNILLVMRNQRNLAMILKASPYGELETLKLLSSLLDKQLISISLSDEEAITEDDNVVPVRERSWAALTSPINGKNNLAFYNKVDDEKDFVTICKEMNISLSAGREILKYLFELGKIGLKKKQ
ncbi:MAG: DUF4388 domain-containing protein [Caldisericaceae bacterium]